MKGYNLIHNTILFLRIIPLLFDMEHKCITNIGVIRLIIKIQIDSEMENLCKFMVLLSKK